MNLFSQIPGEEKEYLSSDSYCIIDQDVGIEADWITAEFSNEIKNVQEYQIMNWF